MELLVSDWIRVKPSDHCPICDHDTWCTYNDEVCICMRVANEHPKQFKDGSVGYIHRLTDEPRKPFVPQRREKPAPAINVEAMMSGWASKTSPDALRRLADELGVRTSALLELRAAWAAQHTAWAFPMRDGAGKMVGIRLRNSKGDKWAVTGSKQGLFLPYCEPEKQVVFVEGPTDCAAGLSIGLFCVGRPSCSGGLFDIQAIVKRLGIREAVIVADNDDERQRPDGSFYNPGVDGAESLAAQLDIPTCVVILPVKDMREAVRGGMTAEDFEGIVRQGLWKTGRP
jgi:hypothetical protein